MKLIFLTLNKKTIIDDCDYPLISKYKWYAAKTKPNRYIAQTGFGVLMHRLILNPDKGVEVDHINHNTLDNRRSNLRLVTSRQNHWNRPKRENTKGSRFKGVHPMRKKFRAIIRVNNKNLILGLFENEKDAANAYDNAAIINFGEFACTNKMLGII